MSSGRLVYAGTTKVLRTLSPQAWKGPLARRQSAFWIDADGQKRRPEAWTGKDVGADVGLGAWRPTVDMYGRGSWVTESQTA